jgi:hypothetical protein
LIIARLVDVSIVLVEKRGFCFIGLAQNVRWPSNAFDKRLATNDGLGRPSYKIAPGYMK